MKSQQKARFDKIEEHDEEPSKLNINDIPDEE